MNIKRNLLILALLVLAGTAVFAQTTASHPVTLEVNAVAIIDLNDTGAITLSNALGATLPGDPPSVGSTDATKYLRYTVVSAGSGLITVHWEAADQAPAGVELSVVAAVGAGEGTAAAAFTFPDNDATAGNLVTAIPSCYTGRGATDGANLTYTYAVTDPALLTVGDNHTVTVTYTIAGS